MMVRMSAALRLRWPLAAVVLSLAGGLGTAIPTVASADPAPAPAAAPQWVMGYYASYQRDRLPPAAIAWNGLTHIVMARLKANADGTLDTDFDWDPVNGPALARDVARRAHAAGRKAILMLGGDDNSPLVHDAVVNHRAAFVANLVAAVRDLGYDGLDLDWENTIDWPAFVAFAGDLRKALPKAVLTMPVGTLNLNYQSVDPHIPEIARKLDRVSIMAYYPATAWAGSGWLSWFNSPLGGEKPATPVSIASSLRAYAAAGIAKAKLGLGTSFYAICYTGGITGPNQSTEGGVAIAGGDNDFPLSALYGAGGAFRQTYRHWYAAASEPYLTLPRPESHGCRYLSFEDEQSLLAKGAFSRRNGYGGIIVWTINQGVVPSHSRPNFLMDALEKGFLRPGASRIVGLSILDGPVQVRTGARRRFSALVTGTGDKAVTWQVKGSGCGRIDGRGVYTAPAAETSCTILARSHADPARTATVAVAVSNVRWTPSFEVSRPGQWWVEVTALDPDATAMSIRWPDGSTAPLQLFYRRADTDDPVFAANYLFPDAGGRYLFTVRAADGRSATARLAVPACDHGADGACR